MNDLNQPVFQKIDGYSYYNFAILHTKGYEHVFDMLRYDRAFLARKSDVEDMKEAAKNYCGKHALRPKSILICRYDWKGKTKPNFTPARLLSNQEYEFVDDPVTLHELNADFVAARPVVPLKVQSELEVTGQLPFVLDIMYLNKAVPLTESDAHKIEKSFYAVPGQQKITVKLVTFVEREKDWKMP